jgi:hypothetical protein
MLKQTETTIKKIAALIVVATLYPSLLLFGVRLKWDGKRWRKPWYIETLEKSK